MRVIYILYFFFSMILSFIVISISISNSIKDQLIKEKETLLQQQHKIMLSLQKRLETKNQIEKLKLKTINKNQAYNICLSFLEQLRNKFPITIMFIKDNTKTKTYMAKVKLTLNMDKKTVNNLITNLIASKSPVVYIGKLHIDNNNKYLEITLKQPYL